MPCDLGAQNILYACVSPTLEGLSGVYVDHCMIARTDNKQLHDKTLQQQLWDVSMRQAGLIKKNSIIPTESLESVMNMM